MAAPEPGPRRVHVYPVGDLVGHELVGCMPEVEAVFRRDGTTGLLITHHSLDGRELGEPPADDTR